MLNKAILIGNVGKEPEFRKGNNYELCNLTVATSEYWKDKSTGERKDKTEWHSITVNNINLISIVKNYITKGSKVYIEGVIRTKKYTNKEGKEVYQTYIEIGFNATIKILDKKKEEAQLLIRPAATNKQDPLEYDDIPF